MISFTLLTTTPKVLRDKLVEYGWLDAEFNPRDGLEIVETPNPIVTTPAVGVPGDVGYVPAVMDARRVFMVKIAHKALEDDTDGDDQTDAQGNLKSVLLRTKFGKALKALNPTREVITLPAASWTRRCTPNSGAHRTTSGACMKPSSAVISRRVRIGRRSINPIKLMV